MPLSCWVPLNCNPDDRAFDGATEGVEVGVDDGCPDGSLVGLAEGSLVLGMEEGLLEG